MGFTSSYDSYEERTRYVIERKEGRKEGSKQEENKKRKEEEEEKEKEEFLFRRAASLETHRRA